MDTKGELFAHANLARDLCEDWTLMTLPYEIRLTIISQHFSSVELELLSSKRTGVPSLHSRCNKTHPLALLRVSRQLRSESLPLLQHLHLKITALFSSWHSALPQYDAIRMPDSHAKAIRRVDLRFLDTNFMVLKSLVNLEIVDITPPGETKCKRLVTGDDPLTTVWRKDEINGPAGRAAMTEELLVSMRLMGQLLRCASPPLRCRVYYNVGFKFLVRPLRWSPAGRLVSTRSIYHSVRCHAVALYDGQREVPNDCVEITSVTVVET